MPLPHCTVVVAEMTNVMSQDEELRAMLREGRPHTEVMERLLEKVSPEERDTAYVAFSELPRATVQMIIRSWASAEKAGLRFRLESVAPTNPDEYVQHGRVRLVLDYDDEGITMYLCHVAGAHADWFAPQQSALVAG